jgi:hypothetical protein
MIVTVKRSLSGQDLTGYDVPAGFAAARHGGLPEVVASSADPLLMITRRMPGTSLFEVADSIDPDHAARQLVRFLAAMHDPPARQRAEAAVGTLTGPQLPPATTRTLRERLGTWIRPDQRRTVVRWCDWADAVLGSPGPAVLVHGDLHGNNQVWDRDELRLGQGPGRALQRNQHRPRSATRSYPALMAPATTGATGAEDFHRPVGVPPYSGQTAQPSVTECNSLDCARDVPRAT